MWALWRNGYKVCGGCEGIMKTQEIQFTRTEIQYLMNLVKDHIDSGVYWAFMDGQGVEVEQKKFNEMQNRILDKLSEGIRMIDPDGKGFVGEY